MAWRFGRQSPRFAELSRSQEGIGFVDHSDKIVPKVTPPRQPGKTGKRWDSDIKSLP